MLTAIKSEYLKIKRTTIIKLVFFTPLMAAFIAIGFNLLGGVAALRYNRETLINQWALMWLPLQITLLAGMLNNVEQKNTQFKTSLALPLDLAKKEVSRISLVLSLVLASSIVMVSLMSLTPFLSPTVSLMTLGSCVTSLSVLVVVNLWQLPLWLWLSRQTNFYVCVIANVLLHLELGSRFAPQGNWLLVPWAWGLKVQAFFSQVYPNGLPIPSESRPFTTFNDLIFASIGSLILVGIFSWIASQSYTRMEVK